MTSEDLMTALTFAPVFSPSSSTDSFVVEAVTVKPSRAIRRRGQKHRLSWHFRSKSHAHAENPRMIIKRRQRTGYAMVWHDRVLISDAEVELHTVVDLKTAKHDTHARKELV